MRSTAMTTPVINDSRLKESCRRVSDHFFHCGASLRRGNFVFTHLVDASPLRPMRAAP